MTAAPSKPDRVAIVFDTETTGLIENSARPLKAQPHIIELAAVKLRFTWKGEGWAGSEEGFFSSLFHHKKLPEETEGITGISQAMVDDAPQFASKLREMQHFFLGTGILVGHNLSFDRDMLAIELRRLDALTQFPWPPKHICTVEATETIKGFRVGLNDLHEELLGTRFSEHHRAEPDTRATARVFTALVERGMVRI